MRKSETRLPMNEIVTDADGLKKELILKVFGVGGAGCNAVEHIAQGEFAGVKFAAVNTDIQSLVDLSVECVVPLGAMLTRGLGAGGDPEVGRAAAEEDAEQLRKLCAGSINVDFADLCAVVRGQHVESSFACAEARGEHRAREVVEKLLASPLLDGGTVLNEAESVLVSLVAGCDLTMAEVNRVMSQINHACENAHIIMGAAVEADLGDRLCVTVVATRPADSNPEKNRVASAG